MGGVHSCSARRAGRGGRRPRASMRLWISDHYHPWNDEQGHSPLRLVGDRGDRSRPRPADHDRGHLPHHADPPRRRRAGGGNQRGPARGALRARVSAPARRSTSTSSATRWPEADERLDMLEESIEVIRASCGRAAQSAMRRPLSRRRTHASTTCPTHRPRSTSPGSGRRPRSSRPGRRRLLHDDAGRRAHRPLPIRGRDRSGASWREGAASARRAEAARHTAHRLWPNVGLPGELAQVLPTPTHFEQAGELVTELVRPALSRKRTSLVSTAPRRSRVCR